VTKAASSGCRVIAGAQLQIIWDRLRAFAKSSDDKGKRKAAVVIAGSSKRMRFEDDRDSDSDEEL
jgi:hypothetical protein